MINYITADADIVAEDITDAATKAHQALNEPEMMAISFPESKQASTFYA
ncbi:hypothetical protein [Legionella fallonii]|nr:hypothetical protein [Legionella fallonii]